MATSTLIDLNVKDGDLHRVVCLARLVARVAELVPSSGAGDLGLRDLVFPVPTKVEVRHGDGTDTIRGVFARELGLEVHVELVVRSGQVGHPGGRISLELRWNDGLPVDEQVVKLDNDQLNAFHGITGPIHRMPKGA